VPEFGSLVAFLAVLALLIVLLARRVRTVVSARTRLERIGSQALAASDSIGAADRDSEPGGLARWLQKAGLRGRGAVSSFLAATVIWCLAGVALVAAIELAGGFAYIARGLEEAPGGLGDGLTPLLIVAPWILIVSFTAIPYLQVRRRRRGIVREVQRDLPNALELVASLAQAGLSFDAAIARLLPVLREDHALARELRTFQAEVLSGRGRITCLRRFAARLDVPQTTRFVSALVQAEQLGAGLGESLRHQAGDLRNDLRERALRRAQTLPGKLVFPLVICFLPGIFVVSLGPALAVFLDEVTVPTGVIAGPQGDPPPATSAPSSTR
jgi:tight adherence protein C